MYELRVIVERRKIKWREYSEILKELKNDAIENAPFSCWEHRSSVCNQISNFSKKWFEVAVDGSFIPLLTFIESYIPDRT